VIDAVFVLLVIARKLVTCGFFLRANKDGFAPGEDG
jgi:hypothetical protein